jgi:hypothetical protein
MIRSGLTANLVHLPRPAANAHRADGAPVTSVHGRTCHSPAELGGEGMSRLVSFMKKGNSQPIVAVSCAASERPLPRRADFPINLLVMKSGI